MRWRRLLLGLGLAGVALLLIGAAAWTTRQPEHNINREGYERIQDGMTEQEVEGILGGPAGDYTGGRMAPLLILSNTQAWGNSRLWVGEEMTIAVALDSDGKVFLKEVGGVFRGETVLERFRRLLP